IDAKARDASASVNLAVAPFERQPLTRLEFTSKNFDPHAWNAGAPTAVLDGQGRIITDDSRNLQGSIVFTNAKPGAIDEKKLPFSRFSTGVGGGADRLVFQDVQLDLGAAGAFAGAGEWHDGALDVALRTRALDLNGIQKRLHKTRLAGE